MFTKISANNRKMESPKSSNGIHAKPMATVHNFDTKRKAQKREEALKQIQAEAKCLSW